MALTKFRLGCAIEPFSRACGNPHISAMNISGVNRDKEFFEPSHQVGADTSKYQYVPPNYFACNLMHVGRDCVLPIAMNHTDRNKIVSPAYTVFSLKDATPLLREYFFMMLKCPERDREFWFHTDASVRDGMAWKDFCDIDIDLPPLAVQEKYVAVYNSMVANLKAYEKGLDDLKLACDATIEELRRKHKCEKIGPYLRQSDERNGNMYGVESVRGISIKKEFIPTKADMKGVPLCAYKVVKANEFSYVTITSRNGEKITLALNDSNETFIVSSSYECFRTNERALLPGYLMAYFQRAEFDRYARFNSWGSAREAFSWEDMCEVEIPIVDLKTQQSIVDMFSAYRERKSVCEKLRNQIMGMCPILVKGSLEEGKRM